MLTEWMVESQRGDPVAVWLLQQVQEQELYSEKYIIAKQKCHFLKQYSGKFNYFKITGYVLRYVLKYKYGQMHGKDFVETRRPMGSTQDASFLKVFYRKSNIGTKNR